MHEMGVMLNVVRTATQQAARYGVTKIGSLTLTIGELSGVVPRYMESFWQVATEKTILEGAELIIEEVEGIAICGGCNEEYKVLDNLRPEKPICPHCGSPKWTVKTGREVMIKEIGVPE